MSNSPKTLSREYGVKPPGVKTLLNFTPDREREEFLRALDAAPFDVTEWEAKFIADFLAAPSRWIWTAPRREKVDQMRQEYGHRIPQSVSQRVSESVSSRTLPPFVAGQCAWLLRNEGRIQRCGRPATVKTRQGLELCDQHERHRNEEIERMRQIKTRRMRS